MSGEADNVVSAIIGKWSAAFSKLDAEALAALYSRNAFFFGSNPTLYRGRDGVAAYFNGLQRWRAPRVEFVDRHTGQADQLCRHGEFLAR